MPVILSETRLTASVERGEVRGLTLTRLPDGTLLSESGLKLGDVILSINGHEVAMASTSRRSGLIAIVRPPAASTTRTNRLATRFVWICIVVLVSSKLGECLEAPCAVAEAVDVHAEPVEERHV